jgi:hypothetical protein
MKEKLAQIDGLARELRKAVDLLDINPSKKSSLKTMCQCMLDDVYSITLELGRLKCNTESCTPETGTTQEE